MAQIQIAVLVGSLRRDSLNRKLAGVMGVSVGAMGTSMAQQHLRNILSYLEVPTLGQPEAFIHAREDLFNADGTLGQDSRKFLQGWMDRYVAWVKKHAA